MQTAYDRSDLAKATLLSYAICLAQFLDAKPFTSPDSDVYLRMAEHPFVFSQAPYGYRILTPLLVHFMPGDIPTAFSTLNLFFLAFAGTCLYALCREMEFSHRTGMLGVVFFGFSFLGKFNVNYPFLVDNLTYLLIGLTLLFMMRKKDLWVSVLLTLGVLNKEVALFLIPVHYWVNRKSEALIDLRAAVRTLAVGVVPICAYLLLHFAWAERGVHYSAASIADFIHQKRFTLFPALTEDALWKWSELWPCVFGPLLPLALLNYFEGKGTDFARRSAAFLPFVFLQIFFATDTPRMLVMGFPLIIPFALYEFEETQEANQPLRNFMVLAFVLAYVFLWKGYVFALIVAGLMRVLRQLPRRWI